MKLNLTLSDDERRHLEHHELPLGSEQEIADAFHRLTYEAARRQLTWHAARWKGYQVFKHPIDLWHYAELLWEVKPRTVIETGTAEGGSALYFADLLESYGVRGYSVITMDIRGLSPRWPAHERIFYVPGWDSAKGLPRVGRALPGGPDISLGQRLESPVLVVLDSDHSEAHVRAELDAFAGLVTEGSYLVVEDSNVNGHPVLQDHGPGPLEALEAWLPEHPEFRQDQARVQRQLLSYHTWLRRVAPDRTG